MRKQNKQPARTFCRLTGGDKPKKGTFIYTDQAPTNKVEFGDNAVEDLYFSHGQNFVSGVAEDSFAQGFSYVSNDGIEFVSYISSEYEDENGYKKGVNYSEPPTPVAEAGGYCLQSKGGVRFDIGSGAQLSAGENYIRILRNGVVQERGTYKLSVFEGGFESIGAVMRDQRPIDLGENDDTAINHKLDDLSNQYTRIGRNPSNKVSKIAIAMKQASFTRNPPLVEKINVIYEFPDDYNIGTESDEQKIISDDLKNKEKILKSSSSAYDIVVNAIQSIINPDERFNKKKNNARTNKRYNVFNFDDRNKLIERIEGTGVDFYGNILDINRQVVVINKEKEDRGGVLNDNIIEINRRHRRGIAYHFEINTRKENEENTTAINDFIYKKKSKLFIDIDKEGLTKLNVPATSKFGSVPIFTRYGFNTPYTKNFDISIDDFQFGNTDTGAYENVSGLGSFNGIEIKDDNLKGVKLYNMPYHNVIATASRIIANAYNTKKSGGSYIKSPATLSEIAKNLQGGRSFSANLDGSLELAIGADRVDKKSFVLDTAGSIINRVGRDLKGRSIITQTDGDVFVQVGGVGPTDADDERFVSESSVSSFRAGTVILQVVTNDSQATRPRAGDGAVSNLPSSVPQDQIIRITKDGVEMVVNGKFVIDAMNDVEISSLGIIKFRGTDIQAVVAGLPPKPIAKTMPTWGFPPP